MIIQPGVGIELHATKMRVCDGSCMENALLGLGHSRYSLDKWSCQQIGKMLVRMADISAMPIRWGSNLVIHSHAVALCSYPSHGASSCQPRDDMSLQLGNPEQGSVALRGQRDVMVDTPWYTTTRVDYDWWLWIMAGSYIMLSDGCYGWEWLVMVWN